MLKAKYTNSFKHDLRKISNRGFDSTALIPVIDMLIEEKQLPPQYHDHKLQGQEFKGCRECHIKPDWLLVYRIIKKELILELLYTGTHSDLF